MNRPVSITDRVRIAALAGVSHEAYRQGKRAVNYIAKRLQDRFTPTEMPYKRRRIAYRGPRSFRRVRRRRGYYGRRRRGKMRRRSYRRRTYRIGLPMNMGVSKRTVVQLFSAVNFDSRTLYSRDLTGIPLTTVNAIDERQREIINVSGFKIQGSMRNRLNNQQGPQLVHFAVLCNVANIAAECVPAVQDDSVPNTNFFRGSSGTRAIDFGTGLSGIQLHTLKINKDNYVVLKRRTFKLATQASDQNTQAQQGDQYTTPTVKNFKWWIPLRRQVRYDNSLYATQGRCFIVWWSDLMHGRASGATPQGAAFSLDMENITYWREVNQ